MKVLVTGGAGFIGSAVVPTLQKEEYDMYVLDNLSFGNRDFIDVPNDHFYEADIRDAEKVFEIITRVKPDVILHLAAIHFIPYCNKHPYEASDVNISGTMNIFDAAKKVHGLRKFVFASTAAVYPISDIAMNEKHNLGPLDIYGLSKLTGEHLCNKFFMESKIDTIVCRFFNAFGPNETNPHLFPEIEKQLREGKRKIRLGNLTPKRDFIHTHDMAAAVKQILTLEDVGFDIFNLGRGIEYSVVEIVEAFERQLNEPIEIDVDQARVRKVERQHLLADVSKLKEIAMWEPVWDIDEGIADLVKNWNSK